MREKFDRLHIVLAILLGLGVGYRALSSHRSGERAQPALAAHLSRLPATGKRVPREKGGGRPPRARAGTHRPDTTSGPRVERTAAGAMPPRAPDAAPLTPLGGTQRVDMDMASERVLEALPGIGPSLARRLVQDRESNGPFGSLQGLQRVKGVGPRLSERLAPYVTFGGSGRPSNVIPIPVPAGSGHSGGTRRREGRPTPFFR